MIVFASQVERMDALLEFGRWLKLAIAGGHQQFELSQHFFHHAGASIIPGHDPFGRVAPANNIDLGVGAVMCAALARDVDEQALVAGRDRVRNPEPGVFEHMEALLERGAEIFLVGKGFRHNTEHFVDVRARGVGDLEMRHRGRVEAARQHA